MGQKKKAGKTRLDRYYYLAKELGYRSRAAFKLIQLDNKHHFLSDARVCLDLCAAPGGWCQVAAKKMPVSSTIVGVDLDRIAPIKGVITLMEDITTGKCRRELRRHIPGDKADVVLHDGAPNVGGAWSKEAYGQSELVLHSLKLATEFLRAGGTFVTKIFRSADYNSLLWVFKQFFRRVDATKPPSSRNTSAEIFVVCKGYLAPTRIDPALLDPASVFEMVEEDHHERAVSVLHKKAGKKERNRSGYDATLGPLLTRRMSVAEYVAADDAARALTDSHELHFNDDDSKVYLTHAATTEEIKECCKDLRLLGKRDFKALVRWWRTMRRYRDELEKEAAAATAAEEEEAKAVEEAKTELTAEEAEAAEEKAWLEQQASMDSELAKIMLSKRAREKRAKKKLRQMKRKLRERIALGMEATSVDLGTEQTFALSSIRGGADLDEVRAGGGATVEHLRTVLDEEEVADVDPLAAAAEDISSDDEQGELELLNAQLERSYETYRQAKARHLPEYARKKRKAKHDVRLESLSSTIAGDDDASDDAEQDNPLLMHLKEEITPAERSARWFGGDMFGGLAEGVDAEDSDDDDDDDDGAYAARRRRAVASDDDDEDDDDDDDSPSLSKLPRDKNPFLDMEMPMTDKQKRRAKRQKQLAKERAAEAKEKKAFEVVAREFDTILGGAEAVEAAKSSRPSREGADELGLVGEETQEQRAKRMSLLAAGMGVAADDDADGDSDDDFRTTAAQPDSRRQRKLARKAERKRKRSDDDDGSDLLVEDALASDAEEDGAALATAHAAASASGRPVDDDEDAKFVPVPREEDYDSDEKVSMLGLATMMLRARDRRNMIDDAYNRWAFNDDNLPVWFREDEERFMRPQKPLPPEVIARIKARFKSLDERPIAKVAEARARRKRRVQRALAKARKRAETIADSAEMTEAAKMRAIQKLMRKAEVKRPDKTYVVNKKGGGYQVGTRTAGKLKRSRRHRSRR
eukprot:PLAT3352.5.p1 GENE.PLAT3352.5~~PLAT3352.5.p1  ORF type:complete len:997 (+),score=577.45 PLAT3352.5:55-2991(+)